MVDMRSLLKRKSGVNNGGQVPELLRVAAEQAALAPRRQAFSLSEATWHTCSLHPPHWLCPNYSDTTQPATSASPTSTNEHLHPPRFPEKPEDACLKSENRVRSNPTFASSLHTLPQQCCEPTPGTRVLYNQGCGRGKMALSKQQRISILLAIDGVFFLVELIIGMAAQIPWCPLF